MAGERWLVTGASGFLGGHVLRRLGADAAVSDVLALAGRGQVVPSRADVRRVDLADADACVHALAAFRPTHVAHVGAMTAVGDCYQSPEKARAANTEATIRLAQAAAADGARFVFSSTDMVFDGSAAPYRESDAPSPLSVYGRSKADAEAGLHGLRGVVVARIPLMFGFACTARPGTFASQIAALRGGQPLRLFEDEHRTPIWVVDAARAMVALARSGVEGVIHVAGPERLSRYELIARSAAILGVSTGSLSRISRTSIAAAEPRPADLSLDGRRFAAEFPAQAPGPLRAEVFEEAVGGN